VAHSQKDWTRTDENVIFWDRMIPDVRLFNKEKVRNPYKGRVPTFWTRFDET